MSILFPLMVLTPRFVDLVVGRVGPTPLLCGSVGGRCRDRLANHDLGETRLKKQYGVTPECVNEKYSLLRPSSALRLASRKTTKSERRGLSIMYNNESVWMVPDTLSADE
jgi:hypothetical protein